MSEAQDPNASTSSRIGTMDVDVDVDVFFFSLSLLAVRVYMHVCDYIELYPRQCIT